MFLLLFDVVFNADETSYFIEAVQLTSGGRSHRITSSQLLQTPSENVFQHSGYLCTNCILFLSYCIKALVLHTVGIKPKLTVNVRDNWTDCRTHSEEMSFWKERCCSPCSQQQFRDVTVQLL